MSYSHNREGNNWCGARGEYVNCDRDCSSCSWAKKNEKEEDKCPKYYKCGKYQDRYCYYGDWQYCSKYNDDD